MSGVLKSDGVNTVRNPYKYSINAGLLGSLTDQGSLHSFQNASGVAISGTLYAYFETGDDPVAVIPLVSTTGYLVMSLNEDQDGTMEVEDGVAVSLVNLNRNYADDSNIMSSSIAKPTVTGSGTSTGITWTYNTADSSIQSVTASAKVILKPNTKYLFVAPGGDAEIYVSLKFLMWKV